MTADDQHFCNAVERIANMTEKLVLGAYDAPVLSGEFQMFVNLFLNCLLRTKLQYLCRLVVDKDNGVIEAYGSGFRS